MDLTIKFNVKLTKNKLALILLVSVENYTCAETSSIVSTVSSDKQLEDKVESLKDLRSLPVTPSRTEEASGLLKVANALKKVSENEEKSESNENQKVGDDRRVAAGFGGGGAGASDDPESGVEPVSAVERVFGLGPLNGGAPCDCLQRGFVGAPCGYALQHASMSPNYHEPFPHYVPGPSPPFLPPGPELYPGFGGFGPGLFPFGPGLVPDDSHFVPELVPQGFGMGIGAGGGGDGFGMGLGLGVGGGGSGLGLGIGSGGPGVHDPGFPPGGPGDFVPDNGIGFPVGPKPGIPMFPSRKPFPGFPHPFPSHHSFSDHNGPPMFPGNPGPGIPGGGGTGLGIGIGSGGGSGIGLGIGGGGPGIGGPGIGIPGIVVPGINVPGINVPGINVPGIPEIGGPGIGGPGIGGPGIEGPGIGGPGIGGPGLIPEHKLPPGIPNHIFHEPELPPGGPGIAPGGSGGLGVGLGVGMGSGLGLGFGIGGGGGGVGGPGPGFIPGAPRPFFLGPEMPFGPGDFGIPRYDRPNFLPGPGPCTSCATPVLLCCSPC